MDKLEQTARYRRYIDDLGYDSREILNCNHEFEIRNIVSMQLNGKGILTAKEYSTKSVICLHCHIPKKVVEDYQVGILMCELTSACGSNVDCNSNNCSEHYPKRVLKKLVDWQLEIQKEALNPTQEKNHSFTPSAINYYLKKILGHVE